MSKKALRSTIYKPRLPDAYINPARPQEPKTQTGHSTCFDDETSSMAVPLSKSELDFAIQAPIKLSRAVGPTMFVSLFQHAWARSPMRPCPAILFLLSSTPEASTVRQGS